MADIYIQTEECYRKMRRLILCDWTNREFITSKELVNVLNSAAEDGPDRHYVLASGSGQVGKALISGIRNP